MITRVFQALQKKKTQRRFSHSDIPGQERINNSSASLDPTLPVEAFDFGVDYDGVDAKEENDPLTKRRFKVVYVNGLPVFLEPEPSRSTTTTRDSVLIDDESVIDDDSVSIDTSCSIVFSTASMSYQTDVTTVESRGDNDDDDNNDCKHNYQYDDRKDGSKLGAIEETSDDKDLSMQYQHKHRERFYCPYRGCTKSAVQIRTVMKHIRDKHFADCPPLSTSNKRLYRTPSGDVLHFNSENCRNTLEYGDEVIREFTDNAVRFYCPYQGCWAASKNLGYLHTHIKRKHYAAYPKSPRFIRINRTRNGKTLDFSEKGRNTIQNGDEIFVEHLVDQGDHDIPVNKGASSRTDPKEAVSTTVASSITRKPSPNYAVIKEITKGSVKESYTQTPLSMPVNHTIQEYARKRSYSC